MVSEPCFIRIHQNSSPPPNSNRAMVEMDDLYALLTRMEEKLRRMNEILDRKNGVAPSPSSSTASASLTPTSAQVAASASSTPTSTQVAASASSTPTFFFDGHRGGENPHLNNFIDRAFGSQNHKLQFQHIGEKPGREENTNTKIQR